MQFGFFTRKHQCRTCGIVACAGCLSPKIYLMNQTTKEEQFCCKNCKESVGKDGKAWPIGEQYPYIPDETYFSKRQETNYEMPSTF